MASPVSAQVILCDAAVADPSGKVHMLGAGWSITGTPTSPQAVAILLKVPWDRANIPLPLTVQLYSEDGQPVLVATTDGEKVPVKGGGRIEVGRPAGIAPGSMLDAAWVLNVGPLPLQPGRYEWRLTFAELDLPAPFTVRS
ncbi:DUF6941 family protein [Luedemannella helvata]|uniref:Uncharacterized protein n=1 Tax=Luedemannella helvata TaxID=349315 RepID=A0ABP4WP53_9ACTN